MSIPWDLALIPRRWTCGGCCAGRREQAPRGPVVFEPERQSAETKRALLRPTMPSACPWDSGAGGTIGPFMKRQSRDWTGGSREEGVEPARGSRRTWGPPEEGGDGMRKIHSWLGDLCDLHLAPVCDHGDSIQWILHLPYHIMAEQGADPCPDLPGDPSLPGGLCGHVLIGGYYRKVSLRVGTGLAVCCAGLPFAVQRRRPTRFFCGGGSVRDHYGWAR